MKKTGRIILRILILIILFLFSFAAVYPLIFLLGGSLKSTPELGNNLAALWSADGTLHWTWLPFEPTLRHYVELLLDQPGYYVMFWNSVKIVGGVDSFYSVCLRHGDSPAGSFRGKRSCCRSTLY